MDHAETKRFNELYQLHLLLLKLQGKAQKTVDAYSRAVRRIKDYLAISGSPKIINLLKTRHYWV